MRALVAATYLLFTATICFAQIPLGPTQLVITAPVSAPANVPAKVDVSLLDAQGRAVVADRDIQVRIAAGAKASVDQPVVTVKQGTSSATVNITPNAAGISEIRAETALLSHSLLEAVSTVGVSPAAQYVPVPPLSIRLDVSPRAKLYANLDEARIVARLIDRNNTPVAAVSPIDIEFPGFAGPVTPRPLRIQAGFTYGEATFAPQNTGTYSLLPAATPTHIDNNLVVPDKLELEYVPPIVGVRIIGDQPSHIGLQPRDFTLTVALFDNNGQPIAADNDRTVYLTAEPSIGGVFGKTEIIIPKDQKQGHSTFRHYQEGKVKIGAVAPGLKVEPVELDFRYSWFYFVIVASLAGLCGGFVRWAGDTPRTLLNFLLGVALGAAFGAIAFVIAPLLISVGLKPDQLKDASKWFEAVAWGFIGGGTGPALFRKLFPATSSAPEPPKN